MNSCTYVLAWIGKCGNPATGSFCEVHKTKFCQSCGKPATHECDETFGLVCGSPLCDDCEHELTEDGVNVCDTRHVKKSEQKFKPWYVQEMEKDAAKS